MPTPAWIVVLNSTESITEIKGTKEKRAGRKLTEKGKKFMEELQWKKR